MSAGSANGTRPCSNSRFSPASPWRLSIDNFQMRPLQNNGSQGQSPLTSGKLSASPSTEDREAELRRSMLDIQNDPSLEPREKARRMQLKRPSSRNSELSCTNSAAPRSISSFEEDKVSNLLITSEDLVASFYAKDETRFLGCEHYRTNCKVRAECCGSWYCCRYCHDDVEDHSIDRHKIKFMLCMLCKTAQPTAKSCRACNKIMAHYHCALCNLWDDDPDKVIFHCSLCGICRKGKRDDYIHCERCRGCISATHFSIHVCRDGSLEGNCPICNENLFGTTEPIQLMKCGHPIHFWCFQDYTKNSYQCPICLKSVLDTTYFFKCIEDVLATQQMPEEYAHKKSLILCNDCEKKSVVPFHFIYHRCAHCRSFNTKALGTVKDDSSSIEYIQEA